jgi:hypothetical protein
MTSNEVLNYITNFLSLAINVYSMVSLWFPQTAATTFYTSLDISSDYRPNQLLNRW